MKALVLCGGKGTRLRPLTYSIPKQLIPIANRPVVHYVMDHLRDVDIREVGVIVAPETAEQVKTALADNPWRFALSFILQDQPLGLAHALLAARDFLGSDPFVMYLGDNLIGSGLRSLLEQFRQESADAVLLLKAVPDPRRFGVAVMDGAGRLSRLIEKPAEPPSNLALVGVYVFSPVIHDAVRVIRPSARGELEITDAIQELLQRGRRVPGPTLQPRRLAGWKTVWSGATPSSADPPPIIKHCACSSATMPRSPCKRRGSRPHDVPVHTAAHPGPRAHRTDGGRGSSRLVRGDLQNVRVCPGRDRPAIRAGQPLPIRTRCPARPPLPETRSRPGKADLDRGRRCV